MAIGGGRADQKSLVLLLPSCCRLHQIYIERLFDSIAAGGSPLYLPHWRNESEPDPMTVMDRWDWQPETCAQETNYYFDFIGVYFGGLPCAFRRRGSCQATCSARWTLAYCKC